MIYTIILAKFQKVAMMYVDYLLNFVVLHGQLRSLRWKSSLSDYYYYYYFPAEGKINEKVTTKLLFLMTIDPGGSSSKNSRGT